MVEVMYLVLINTGVSSVLLFVLLLILAKRSDASPPSEERVYLSKDMHKIKEQVVDSAEEM
ncbi:MAG: hypothetical protein AABY16_04835, partial [Nanoarchaeota archaeon]